MKSPFTLSRFEYESEHLYFLPQPLFSDLESQKPTYIIGTRGTGKTTLLKALNWDERLTNKSLQMALGYDNLFNDYIGIYLKLSEADLPIIENWMDKLNDNKATSIFSLYLDFMWVEMACFALPSLLAKSYYNLDPKLEHEFVSNFINDFLFLSENDSNVPMTFIELGNTIKETRREINRCAKEMSATDSITPNIYRLMVGEFGKKFGELFDLYFNKSKSNEINIHIKVCLDEAESLSSRQQLILNHIVRTSKYPISFIAAYVTRRDDLSSTLLSNMTLQIADREIILLDNIEDSTFKQLAEGVASVRIKSIVDNDNIKFDLTTLLGSLSINKLLTQMLKMSEKPTAKKLLNKANKFRSSEFYRESQISDELPIYQAYIVDKLSVNIPKPNSEAWERRRQDSAELRKRIVSSYLYICSELNITIKYAFAKMVLQISDLCIRDFLAQIDMIFKYTDMDLKSFINSEDLSIDIQDKAIKEASKRKKESLPNSEVTSPIEIQRLVDALARITARLQTDYTKLNNLRSSERGIFIVDKNEQYKQAGITLELIHEASEAGFLKIVNSDGNKVRFRVHCSLAPAYGFSYRGAYYSSNISIKNLLGIITSENKEDLNKQINDLVNILNKEEQVNYTLFPKEI